MSVTTISVGTIEALGARRMADLYRQDASVSDAYNAVGYWDYATVRGYVLNQSSNWRRNGLPISAETSIALENKERIEILKGTSGIQSGTSAPGGLINYVVKRPPINDVRSLRLEATDVGSHLVHLDLGGHLGAERSVGYRLNIAGENPQTSAPYTQGQRHLLALAVNNRPTPDTLLEAELEWSHRRQRSVPGLSLLGNKLPPADPRININSQSWSAPNVFDNFSASMGIKHNLSANWQVQAHLATQRLNTNDHLAYPFGCFDANAGTYYADRFCPNGNFDLYDYRSEREQRNTESAQLLLKGQTQTGWLRHNLTLGLQATRSSVSGHPYATALAGTGNLYTLPAVAANPDYSTPYTLRGERSKEFFAYDVFQWSPQFQTWLGLRYTRLQRSSVNTDGSEAIDYTRHLTTPWLSAVWQLQPQFMLYASYGQGVEAEVVPNQIRYSNAGQALPALKSRQFEIGIKHQGSHGHWSATLFDIERPGFADAGACDSASSCTRQLDGHARHRGLEWNGTYTLGAWTAQTSLTVLHARVLDSKVKPSLNGLRPVNVPGWIARAHLIWRAPEINGLSLSAGLSHEAQRSVLPDGSITLPAWTRLDAALRYSTTLAGYKSEWTVAIDNLTDKRYFQESPYQYGHVWLFPAPPRTLRVALNLSL